MKTLDSLCKQIDAQWEKTGDKYLIKRGTEVLYTIEPYFIGRMRWRVKGKVSTLDILALNLFRARDKILENEKK